jgi:hypothetical protein
LVNLVWGVQRSQKSHTKQGELSAADNAAISSAVNDSGNCKHIVVAMRTQHIVSRTVAASSPILAVPVVCSSSRVTCLNTYHMLHDLDVAIHMWKTPIAAHASHIMTHMGHVAFTWPGHMTPSHLHAPLSAHDFMWLPTCP